MANTYEWRIESLDYDVVAENKANVIKAIHWRLLGRFNDCVGQMYGVQQIIFNSDKSFINYADLSEKIIIEWLEAALGAKQIAALKTSIDAQIEAQVNPTTGSGLPWSDK